MGRSTYFHYADGTKFQGKKTNEVFSSIQSDNYWEDSESVSGPGSSLKQTKEIRRVLPKLFEDLHIKSILDIPCGDFNWMKHVVSKGIIYTGADIVSSIVDQNKQKYQTESIHFLRLDLLKDQLDRFDIVFCRDCLVHLSNDDILVALSNIKRSGSTYLVTTTFPEEAKNKDIPTGGWRPVDFEKQPFNFPIPEILINEKCTEGDGLFKDKSLGVWKIDSLIVDK